MPIVARRCADCGHRYEVLTQKGEDVGVLDRDDGLMACAACQSTAFEPLVAVQDAARAPIGAGYPRYDRGLNLMLESEEHRMRVCKERGLRPLDGASWSETFIQPAKRRQTARDAAAARRREEEARANADPAIRRAQDIWESGYGTEVMQNAELLGVS